MLVLGSPISICSHVSRTLKPQIAKDGKQLLLWQCCVYVGGLPAANEQSWTSLSRYFSRSSLFELLPPIPPRVPFAWCLKSTLKTMENGWKERARVVCLSGAECMQAFITRCDTMHFTLYGVTAVMQSESEGQQQKHMFPEARTPHNHSHSGKTKTLHRDNSAC